MVTPRIGLFFRWQLVIDFVTLALWLSNIQEIHSQKLISIRSHPKHCFVKGQGVPRSIEIDANEAYCIHFVLYDDKGKAAATVRLLPNKDLTQVTLQRMAVLVDYQGQGLGSILLKEVEDFAQEQGFQTISLHAQLGALKFYLNNGYQEVGNIFEEAGIQHITVEKSLLSKKA